uniref:ORF2 n=1 Tax=Lone star tick densovirus 1 TaxID=2027355 RepID=A0A223PQZ8_9VIRU|nr:ORF2 [Lone star tick densovirus 1]
MPVLRGHKYFGPGNSLSNGSPVDEDDRIAYKHDLAYDKAVKEGNSDIVREADWDFIKDTYKEGFNAPHAWIGTVGIGLKYGVESITGVLYPKVAPKGEKRTLPEHFKQQKKRIIETPVSSGQGLSSSGGEPSVTAPPPNMPDEHMREVNNEEIATEGGGAGAGNTQQIIRQPHSGSNIMVFKKTFQFYTGGFRFKVEKAQEIMTKLKYTEYFNVNAQALLTPLCSFYVNALPSYLTPYEFHDLPKGTFARQCKVKVTPLGYRLPFATGTAQAGFANSQLVVQCCSAVGLNKLIPMLEGPYKVNQSDMTSPQYDETEEDLTLHYVQKLYGVDNNTVPSCVGVQRHYNNYTTICFPFKDTPRLLEWMSIQDINMTKGNPIINYEYNFKCAPLKDIANTTEAIADTGFYLYAGRNAESWRGRYFEEFKHDNQVGIPKRDELTYYHNIEKASSFCRELNHTTTPEMPPSVHFGIMPVQSNTPLAETAQFSPACGLFEVETELVVEYNFQSTCVNTYLPYGNDVWEQRVEAATKPSCRFTGRAVYGDGGLHFPLSKPAQAIKASAQMLHYAQEALKNLSETKARDDATAVSHDHSRTKRAPAPDAKNGFISAWGKAVGEAARTHSTTYKPAGQKPSYLDPIGRSDEPTRQPTTRIVQPLPVSSSHRTLDHPKCDELPTEPEQVFSKRQKIEMKKAGWSDKDIDEKITQVLEDAALKRRAYNCK